MIVNRPDDATPFWRLSAVILLSLAGLVMLTGCGPTLVNKRMEPAIAARVHTIALMDVGTPGKPYHLDRDAMTGTMLLTGPLLFVPIYKAGTKDVNEGLKSALPNPGAILTDEVEAALKRKGYDVFRVHPVRANDTFEFVRDYSAISVGACDAVLDITASGGYQRFHGTQIDCPLIEMNIRLASPDGKTDYYLDHLTNYDLLLNGQTRIEVDPKQFEGQWQEKFKDPKLVEKEYRLAATPFGDAISRNVAAQQ